MNSRENENANINLMDFCIMLWSHRIIILLFTIATTALFLLKVFYFTDDTYTANGVLYVSNKKDVSSVNTTIQKSDIDSSRTLGLTYIEVLQTRSFLTEVSNSINNKYTWRQIKSMMTISAVNETELIDITVNTATAEDAYKIANNIMQESPKKLTNIFKGGEVEIVDDVTYPTSPDDKGLVKNLIIGAAVGIVLGSLFVFIKSLLDTKVHKSEEVSKRYDVSILGELSL